MKIIKRPYKTAVNKVFLIGTFLCVAFASAPHAQEINTAEEKTPESLTAAPLIYAVGQALKTHPSLESAKALLQSVEEERKATYSGYFPTLSANASGGRMYGDNATSRGLSVDRGAGYSYLWEGSVTARQMIFDGHETKNLMQSAHAREEAADLSLADIRKSLGMATVRSYLNLMRARTGLKMLKEHDLKVSDYLNRIKISVEDGAADEAAYQQARDVKVILESYVADYEGQMRAATAEYIDIVGDPPPEIMAVPDQLASNIPKSLSSAIEIAKNNHPAVKAAKLQSKSASYQVEAETAQLYPDINGELSYLKSDKDDLIGGEVVDARALIRMSWNFETGGGQFADIRKKKYDHKQAAYRVHETQRQIERVVRLSYNELQTAQDQLKSQNLRYDLNNKLYDTYLVQFEGARISLLQLMQAHNQFFNAGLERMNGQFRTHIAQYAILSSMGNLLPTILGDQNIAINNKTTEKQKENGDSQGAVTSYFDQKGISYKSDISEPAPKFSKIIHSPENQNAPKAAPRSESQNSQSGQIAE